jgi:hypothetical protein
VGSGYRGEEKGKRKEEKEEKDDLISRPSGLLSGLWLLASSL